MGIILETISTEELDSKIEKAVLKALDSFAEKGKKESFVTRTQAAEKLHLSKVSLDKWIHSGKLTGYKIGNRVLLKESELTPPRMTTETR